MKNLMILLGFLAIVFAQSATVFAEESVDKENKEVSYESSEEEEEYDDDEEYEEEDSFFERRFFLNAFATIGYAKSDSEIIYSPRGDANTYEYNDRFNNQGSHDALTRYGLQFTFLLDEDTRFLTQLLATGRDKELYEAQTDWAYLSRRVGENLEVKVGLIRTPTGLFAENKEVSFTYHWTQLPNELYSPRSLNNLNGGSVKYNLEFGDESSFSAEVFAGSSQIIRNREDGTTDTFSFENVKGVALNYQNGEFRATYSYFVGQPGAVLEDTDGNKTNEFGVTDREIDIQTFGFLYDSEFLIASEYYYADQESNNAGLRGTIESAYVSVGYRFTEDLLLHYTFSEYTLDFQTKDLAQTASSTQFTDPNAGEYKTFQKIRQISNIVGAKFLLTESSAIKLDIQQVYVPYINDEVDILAAGVVASTLRYADIRGENAGFFAERPDRNVTIFKIGYDFVY